MGRLLRIGVPFGVQKVSQNGTQREILHKSENRVKIELSLQRELDPEGCEGGAKLINFNVVWRVSCHTCLGGCSVAIFGVPEGVGSSG